MWQAGELTLEMSLTRPAPGETSSMTGCYVVNIPDHDVCIDIEISVGGIEMVADRDCFYTESPVSRSEESIDIVITCSQLRP